MSTQADTQEQPRSLNHKYSQHFTKTRIVLTVLFMLCLLLATNTLYRMSLQSDIEMVRFIINGDSLDLDAEAQEQLRNELQIRLAGYEHDIDQQMLLWKVNALEEMESNFQSASEYYLDWYFSFIGSYTRLIVAVSGDLEPWMENQLQQRLVERSGIESSLATLQEEYLKRLGEVEQAWLSETLDGLQQRFTTSDLQVDEAEASQLKTVNLDRLISTVGQDQLLLPRWTADSAVGGAFGYITGVTVAKRMASRPAFQASKAIVTRFVTRMGGHAARSATSGGIAAVSTSPSGPGALVTGATVLGSSLAIAVGTEIALLKVQEAYQRPEMEADLHTTWEELMLEIDQHLQVEKQSRTEAMFDSIDRQATKTVLDSELPKTYRILG
ncbi:hypothetical protein [Halomonas sp. KRD171]|uniref:hypothetical protein n=1 Tax=Halomonas sp. KRD171 TaxID=2729726 RepID=UPI0019D27AB7|nr:hypothetical protein [Halomonas sp. KRD171]